MQFYEIVLMTIVDFDFFFHDECVPAELLHLAWPGRQLSYGYATTKRTAAPSDIIQQQQIIK